MNGSLLPKISVTNRTIATSGVKRPHLTSILIERSDQVENTFILPLSIEIGVELINQCKALANLRPTPPPPHWDPPSFSITASIISPKNATQAPNRRTKDSWNNTFWGLKFRTLNFKNTTKRRPSKREKKLLCPRGSYPRKGGGGVLCCHKRDDSQSISTDPIKC